jgi:hypothetical protein
VNLALWIVAGVLALGFLIAGGNKLITSREKLARAPGAGWANDFSAGFIKTLGTLEVLGAIGLIVPGLVGIAPILVPLAAIGLAVIMVGAGVVELRRHEPKHALVNLFYFALAVFVAVGRLSPN